MSTQSEAGNSVTTEWRSAWTAALDELELDVVTIETMLADERRLAELPESNLWQPPTELGALPLELRPRADEILTRQLAAAEEIARRLTSTRVQQVMTSRIETGEATKRPVFLDCAM
ncbi:hypothetical protein GCM10010435_20170 [Winogradskya consettensis]|uniref:Uncharacterized protein n=1 Tax=Winogradskya consettensis TaxID=113560 RepID=A0A919STB4_9ACTN|nr:hypothetical protein [Actinoplanes consettensis]GIM78136.1 hypothetical protein Aco04nite_58880 [Actinoplanes consettensis]